MPPQPTITMRTALLFFAPLILTTELHQISHSLVHAFLARIGDATIVLAAFSIAFSFNSVISGMMSSCIQAGMSFITDRRSVWQVARFYFKVSLVFFLFIESFALTPLGPWLFGEVIGASPAVAEQAVVASAIMALWIWPNQVRNLCMALCMQRRRTMLISNATLLRMASQVILLFVLTWFTTGAVAGALSLVGCMTVEAAYLYYVGRQIYADLPASGGEQPSGRRLWRFSWPIMLTQATEHGINFIINIFLGRLANPDLALAAFGVVHALKGVVVAPLRNMVHTTQALVQSRSDMRVMLGFVHRITLVFAVVVGVLFWSPLREILLLGVMGLPRELADYAMPGAQAVVFTALVWGYSSLFRGLLSAMRKTRVIAFSAGLRLLVVVAVSSITLAWPELNGAVVGICAIAMSFLVESLLLGWQVRRYSAVAGPIFPRRAVHAH